MTLALALTHAAKPQPFNADFYSVAATVIPVLFVAVAVQGNLHEKLMQASDDMFQRTDKRVANLQLDPAMLRIIGSGLLSWLTSVVASSSSLMAQ